MSRVGLVGNRFQIWTSATQQGTDLGVQQVHFSMPNICIWFQTCDFSYERWRLKTIQFNITFGCTFKSSNISRWVGLEDRWPTIVGPRTRARLFTDIWQASELATFWKWTIKKASVSLFTSGSSLTHWYMALMLSDSSWVPAASLNASCKANVNSGSDRFLRKSFSVPQMTWISLYLLCKWRGKN